MKIDIKVFLLFIAGIVILALLHHNCNRNKTVTKITTVTTVSVDTLQFRDTLYFPKPYKIVRHRIDTLYIDTNATIRNYFTDKYYLLHYQDTALKATADIKVSKNAVELAKLDYEVYRPTIHTTTTITEKSMQRFSLSLGGGINYNILNNRVGVEFLAGVGIKRHSLHFGYDFINQTPRIGWQYQNY